MVADEGLRLLTGIDIPGDRQLIRKARAVAFEALAQDLGPGHQDTIDTGILLLSELLANAIVHSRSGWPGGAVRTQVFARNNKLLRFEVTDDGADDTDEVPRLLEIDEYEENGRGLRLVEELAQSWGATSTGIGAKVWFELVISK